MYIYVFTTTVLPVTQFTMSVCMCMSWGRLNFATQRLYGDRFDAVYDNFCVEIFYRESGPQNVDKSVCYSI